MTITSPSGSVYTWTKDTPPTAEDIAALQEHEAKTSSMPKPADLPKFDAKIDAGIPAAPVKDNWWDKTNKIVDAALGSNPGTMLLASPRNRGMAVRLAGGLLGSEGGPTGSFIQGITENIGSLVESGRPASAGSTAGAMAIGAIPGGGVTHDAIGLAMQTGKNSAKFGFGALGASVLSQAIDNRNLPKKSLLESYNVGGPIGVVKDIGAITGVDFGQATNQAMWGAAMPIAATLAGVGAGKTFKYVTDWEKRRVADLKQTPPELASAKKLMDAGGRVTPQDLGQAGFYVQTGESLSPGMIASEAQRHNESVLRGWAREDIGLPKEGLLSDPRNIPEKQPIAIAQKPYGDFVETLKSSSGPADIAVAESRRARAELDNLYKIKNKGDTVPGIDDRILAQKEEVKRTEGALQAHIIAQSDPAFKGKLADLFSANQNANNAALTFAAMEEARRVNTNNANFSPRRITNPASASATMGYLNPQDILKEQQLVDIFNKSKAEAARLQAQVDSHLKANIDHPDIASFETLRKQFAKTKALENAGAIDFPSGRLKPGALAGYYEENNGVGNLDGKLKDIAVISNNLPTSTGAVRSVAGQGVSRQNVITGISSGLQGSPERGLVATLAAPVGSAINRHLLTPEAQSNLFANAAKGPIAGTSADPTLIRMLTQAAAQQLRNSQINQSLFHGFLKNSIQGSGVEDKSAEVHVPSYYGKPQ